MSDYATKQDIRDLLKEFRVDLMDELNPRFDSIEKHLNETDELIATVVNDLGIHIDKRFDKLEKRLDNHAIRLDRLEVA